MRSDELATQLQDPDGSVRMRAAMAAGSSKEPAVVGVLVERCGIDPDFFVRDMLTWALTRLPADVTVPRLVEELSSPYPQARSQALHTLSKIGDARARPAISDALLHDEEDGVAAAAWRAAVVLLPAGEEGALAADLAQELGLRDAESRRSLTRAFAALGEGSRGVLEHAATVGVFASRVHAVASLLMLDGAEQDFTSATQRARRMVLDAGGADDPSEG